MDDGYSFASGDVFRGFVQFRVILYRLIRLTVELSFPGLQGQFKARFHIAQQIGRIILTLAKDFQRGRHSIQHIPADFHAGFFPVGGDFVA